MNFVVTNDIRRSNSTSRPNSIGIALSMALVVLAAGAVASVWFALPAAWADAVTLSERTTVRTWRDGTGPRYNPQQWETLSAQLQEGLATAPGNAQLHDDLGYLHAVRSLRIGNVPIGSSERALQNELMDTAIQHYRTACALRPTFPYTWAYLALAKHYRGQYDDEFWAAFDHSLQYGHREAALHGVMVEVAFAAWPKLGPSRQKAIATLINSAKAPLKTRFTEMAKRANIQLPG